MKVIDISANLISEVNRKEDMTPEMYIISDQEADQITTSLFNDGKVWVDDSQRVRWSGPRPTPDHDWNGERKEWVVNSERHNKTLEQQRTEAWELIKLHRTSIEEGGVYVATADKWFHTDPEAQRKYCMIGLASLSKIYQPVDWKTMDGSYVKMTPQLFQDLLASLLIISPQIHKIAEQHRIALWKSETPLEYDFTTGWPATYATRPKKV